MCTTVNDARVQVLNRYLERYQPAENKETANSYKTSEDIQIELQDVVQFEINEIAIELLTRGYKVELDTEGLPCFLMRDTEKK